MTSLIHKQGTYFVPSGRDKGENVFPYNSSKIGGIKMAVTFESYERRIDQIKPVMEKYGIKDFEDALKICTDKGFNPYCLLYTSPSPRDCS